MFCYIVLMNFKIPDRSSSLVIEIEKSNLFRALPKSELTKIAGEHRVIWYSYQ